MLTLLAILAISALTTATAAHATRMSMGSGADHAMHMTDMMHAPAITALDCDAGAPCGSGDAAMCAFVCAGLSAVALLPGGEAAQAHGAARHEALSEAIHVSRAPGLNKRPPKPRLL